MTNKTKNIILLISFLVLIILCYRFAISNTLKVKKEYRSLKQQELFFKNTPKQVALLKQKQQYYDSLLTIYQINGNSIQNSLLKTINIYVDSIKVKLIDFVEPHVFKGDDISVKTYQFTLEGNYNDILKLVYKLEQETKFGEIISLNFEKKKNFKTGRFYLQAYVLLKSFG